MATLAPNWAKRTAIAWPMPELPPVTRTFLPFSPGMASVGETVGAAVDMGAFSLADGGCRRWSLRAPGRYTATARGTSSASSVYPCREDAVARAHAQELIRWSTASPDHEAGLPRQPEGAPGGRSDRRAHRHRLRSRRVVLPRGLRGDGQRRHRRHHGLRGRRLPIRARCVLPDRRAVERTVAGPQGSAAVRARSPDAAGDPGGLLRAGHRAADGVRQIPGRGRAWRLLSVCARSAHGSGTRTDVVSGSPAGVLARLRARALAAPCPG